MNDPRQARIDAALLAALTLGLFVFYAFPYVLGGFGFPLGPDAPVYAWWTRLAAHDGLSAVGDRPGVPALVLAVGGTLRLPLTSVIAALEIAMGIGIGLGAASLVRTKTEEDRELAELAGERATSGRAEWGLAAVLVGLYGVHLAAGYVANLAFAVLFVAAAASLAEGSRRGTAAAAILLGAGGLAHPQFFLVAFAVLWFTAVPSLVGGRRGEPLLDSEHGRIGAAVAGGGALLVAGLAALLAGPDPLAVDTSKDAFLRRARLLGSLKNAYRGRFVDRWPRYVQWASVPLGLFGLLDAVGAFLGRFLVAWSVVVGGGITFGLLTAVVPPDRFVTFAFAVPILAALGLVRLWRRLGRRRAVAATVCGGLLVAMALGSFFPWRRQEPFVSSEALAQITDAGRFAAATDPGTPLLFVVDTGDPTITFFATESANAIRAGMPADRIRDVYVVVPEFTGEAHPTRSAQAELYARDATDAIARHGSPLVLQLAEFDRESFGRPVAIAGLPTGEPRLVADGVVALGEIATPVTAPVDALETSSPTEIVVAAVAALALLAIAGYGWARASLRRGVDALALGPAFGAAALIVTAIALERLGVPLDGTAGPTVVSALAGFGGYGAWVLRRRRPLA